MRAVLGNQDKGYPSGHSVAVFVQLHTIKNMVSWLRRTRPIWAALEVSATYGWPTKAAQGLQASAAFPSQSNKSRLLRAFEAEYLGRTICASALQFKGKLGAAVSDAEQPSKAELKSSKRSSRSLSGWQLFLKEQYKDREEVRSELKGDCTSAKMNAGQATRDIAAKWKSLSDTEKKPYLDAASANKQPKSTKAKRLSGYSLFVKENFESVKARNPTIRPKEVLTAMGNEWKSMSDADKNKSKKRADKHNEAM